MSEMEETAKATEITGKSDKPGAEAKDPCAEIGDPFRKGLCRVCKMPVVGEVLVCREHEPPVP